MSKVKFTVVIPSYNEEPSLGPLVEQLCPVMENLGSYEIILVDDGSTDGTAEKLRQLRETYPDILKCIQLRTNKGKSEALQHGFDHAQGEIVVMMDADLQDQPKEISKLITAIVEDGYDAVSGWKHRRHDPVLRKNIPSLIFNWALRKVSGLNIHDFNCGLKAFRRQCLDSFTLYGQFHRFIMVLIASHGYRVGEVKVEHAPRQHGVSKYGPRRFYYGLMDLLTVFFITKYLTSPLYFFGFYGSASLLGSVLIGGYFFGWHAFGLMLGRTDWLLANHPLWLISPILLLLGLIMIFFGLLGELITYHLLPRSIGTVDIKKKAGFEGKISNHED